MAKEADGFNNTETTTEKLGKLEAYLSETAVVADEKESSAFACVVCEL